MATRVSDGLRALEVGVAEQALAGEATSGDIAVARSFDGGALLAAVDGLGHGLEASSAAHRAAAELEQAAGQSVISLVRRCHTALAGTRGVVMSLVSFTYAEDTLTWLAIGNVAGWLFRGERLSGASEGVVMRGGVVGFELPLLRAAVVAVSPGDLLVLATDGIRPDFTRHVVPTDPPQHVADHILSECATGSDDALVLVARYERARARRSS